jgi:hypothetical protein
MKAADREHRRRQIDYLKSEARAAKSSLLNILTALERMDAQSEARKLSAIIGRLEAWQNT